MIKSVIDTMLICGALSILLMGTSALINWFQPGSSGCGLRESCRHNHQHLLSHKFQCWNVKNSAVKYSYFSMLFKLGRNDAYQLFPNFKCNNLMMSHDVQSWNSTSALLMLWDIACIVSALPGDALNHSLQWASHPERCLKSLTVLSCHSQTMLWDVVPHWSI